MRRAERIPRAAPHVLVTTSSTLAYRAVMNSNCPSSMQTEAKKPMPDKNHHGFAGSAIAAKIPSGMNIATLAVASTKW